MTTVYAYQVYIFQNNTKDTHRVKGGDTMDASILMKKLEDNLDTIFDEGKYEEFLSYMARFHRYSLFNQLLILMQRPDAFKVAGYKRWIEEGRQVKKGEKAIGILAPRLYNVYVNAKTGERIEKGSMSRAEINKALAMGIVKKEKRRVGFIGVNVFDIGQTVPINDEDETNEVRMSIEGLKGSFKDLERLKDAIRLATGADITITNELGSLEVMGYYSKDSNEIVLRDLGDVQIAKTLIHEGGHAIAKRLTKDGKVIPLGADTKPEDLLVFSKDDEEVVVESTAYAVMQALGMDVSDYSFGYIRSWATAYKEEKDGKETLLNNLKYISIITSEILKAVEEVFGVSGEEEDDTAVKEEKAEDMLSMLEANTARLKAEGVVRVEG